MLAAVVGGAVALLVSPLVLVGLALAVGQLARVTSRRTRMLARSKAEESGAREPTTVTIDHDGVHLVGPTVVEHHRWDELRGASVRRGFLVLEGSSRSPVQLVCLDHLGPSVDERTLLAEVRRRIAASAPLG